MKMKRTTIIIVALVALVAIFASAFAILYQQKTLSFHGGITSQGNIEVDVLHTSTITTGFDFGYTYVKVGDFATYNVTVRNVGNCPVNLGKKMPLKTWTCPTSGYSLDGVSEFYSPNPNPTWDFGVYLLNPDGTYPNRFAVAIPQTISVSGSLDVLIYLQCFNTTVACDTSPSLIFSASSA